MRKLKKYRLIYDRLKDNPEITTSVLAGILKLEEGEVVDGINYLETNGYVNRRFINYKRVVEILDEFKEDTMKNCMDCVHLQYNSNTRERYCSAKDEILSKRRRLLFIDVDGCGKYSRKNIKKS